MSKHALLTGFEPFGDSHVNPSAFLAERDMTDTRFSLFPLDLIVNAWTIPGVPGYISRSAGTALTRDGSETLIETLLSWLESRPVAPANVSGLTWIPRGKREVER